MTDVKSAGIDAALVSDVADRLEGAFSERSPIAPVREDLAASGIFGAYGVQAELVRRWRTAGRRIVGRKIGLTSRAVQQQLGVDRPDFGTLMADMSRMSGESIAPDEVLQAKVEAEVALVLARELDAPDVTLTELLSAVDYVLPAIEVVGSRIADWDISILDTIADNASCGLFVLGTRPVSPSAVDLEAVTMEMDVDGEVRSRGTGADCLGHPYRAALWLARQLAELGESLRAGDVVMTGALGPMVPLEAGQRVVARIDGLGEVWLDAEAP